jgi:hypothetical protein
VGEVLCIVKRGSLLSSPMPLQGCCRAHKKPHTSESPRSRKPTDLLLPGVDDITAVVLILLEGNPKDKSWAAAAKMMNNVDKFLERLRTFKAVIDDGKVEGGRGLVARERASGCRQEAAGAPRCCTGGEQPQPRPLNISSLGPTPPVPGMPPLPATPRSRRRPWRRAAPTWSCPTSTAMSSSQKAMLPRGCVSGRSTLSSTTTWSARWGLGW